MKTRHCKLFFILFSLLVTYPILAAAQKSADTREFPLNEEILGCDLEVLYQDNVVWQALRQTPGDGVLIAVVRLGGLERSRRLIESRVANARDFFKIRGKGLAPDRVIVAEGPQLQSGLGRIEYYINGRLYQQLLYPKNGFICHQCCGPDIESDPFGKPARKQARKTKRG